MKKSMGFLLCVVSLLISLVYGMHQKVEDTKRLDALYQEGYSFSIYVKDSPVSLDAFLEKMDQISKEYDASIVRTDLLDIDGKSVTVKAGVFSEELLSSLETYVVSGKLRMDSDFFVSTYDTHKKKQVGTIEDLFGDDPMRVENLRSYLDGRDQTGTYTMYCRPSDEHTIVSELSDFLGVDSKDLLESNYQKTYDPGPVQIIYILCILLLLLYALMSFFYPMAQMKVIAVYKLLGMKSKDLWLFLHKNILLFVSIFILATFLVQKLWFHLPLMYFLPLFFYQVVFLFFGMCISFVMLQLIHRIPVQSILKGFYHGRLIFLLSDVFKLVIVLVLVFMIPQVSQSVHTMISYLRVGQAYERVSNQMTLSSYEFVDDEFNQMLNGENSLKEKMWTFFQDVEKSADAEFMYPLLLGKEQMDGYRSSIPDLRSFEDAEHYDLMMVNQNALESLDVVSNTDRLFTSKKVTILAPESNRSNDTLKDVNRVIPLIVGDPDADVQVRYYSDSDKEFFMESRQMIESNRSFVKNPMFICLSDTYLTHQSSLLLSDSMSNPMRIERTKQNQKAIQEAIKNADLEKNHLSFDSVSNTGYREFLQTSKQAVVLTLVALFFLFFVDVLASYYHLLVLLLTKKKELVVKKLLGLSLFERYRSIFLFAGMLYVLGCVQLFVLEGNWICFVLYGILLALDFLILLWMIRRKEKAVIAQSLKGE